MAGDLSPRRTLFERMADAAREPEDICICGARRDQHEQGMGPGPGDCRSFRLASHAPK